MLGSWYNCLPNVTESGEPVISCCASPNELCSKGFLRMNEFRKEGKYCDVNVIVDGTMFPCHRNILASASTYFDNMFGGQFKESEEKEIHLKNLSAECFKNMLEFFYTKELEIDSSNSYELFEASVYFGEGDMENCCVEYMVSHFPQKHIVETCIYAKSNNREQLYEISLLHMAKNWSQLCGEDRLLEISPEILEDVVKRKSLIKQFSDVLNFIPRWKEKQNPGRNKLEKLLQTVERDDTPRLCLFVHLSSRTENYCRIINELMYHKTGLEWKHERSFYIDNYREVNVVANGHLFTFYSSKKYQFAEFRVRKSLYDVHERLTKPPISYAYGRPNIYSMAAIRDTIYFYDCFSGYFHHYELLTEAKNIEKSRRIYAYVYDLDKWFSVPKPQYDLADSCITSVNNQLYLIGSSGSVRDNESTKYAQCYDHRSPNWIVLPETSYARRQATACSYDEKVFVLGGYPNNYSLEVYDPKAGRWQVLQSCSRERDVTRFVSYDDKLWAFPLIFCGSAECYNPVTNLWTGAKLWKESGDGDESRCDGVSDAFVW